MDLEQTKAAVAAEIAERRAQHFADFEGMPPEHVAAAIRFAAGCALEAQFSNDALLVMYTRATAAERQLSEMRNGRAATPAANPKPKM